MSFDYLYDGVSWVLLRWHQFFSMVGLDPAGGLNWAFSIVFLVMTARLLVFPLFIRQVHYQRQMAAMQPRIRVLRERHQHDKPELQRQLTKLQQQEGINPLAGCLPLLLQWPIFLALYHVLRHIAAAAAPSYQADHPGQLSLYTFTKTQTLDAARAKLFDAPMAGRLLDSAEQLTQLDAAGRGPLTLVVLVLVALSAAATFATQRLVRASTVNQPQGTGATVQRLMIWVVPVCTLGSGLFFPLGVLLYWFASNTWTMTQQAYINRFHPHPRAESPVVPGTANGRARLARVATRARKRR